MLYPILNSYDEPAVRSNARQALAAERVPLARAALADCDLCACHCRVNRVEDELGQCRAGVEARVFSAQIEVGDEMELIPTFAIAWSGCDLRCAFCITHQASWNPCAGVKLGPTGLAARAGAALNAGARTVMFLGGEPTIHLPAVLETVAALPETARLVWKTNAHASPQARELLEGMFDVWLADYKFGNAQCAQRLAGVPDYETVVRENLLWARTQAAAVPPASYENGAERGRSRPPVRSRLGAAGRPGEPALAAVATGGSDDPRSGHCERRRRRGPTPNRIELGGEAHGENGAASRGGRRIELIVRHVLLPGHVECCWRPIAQWNARHLPHVKVSLRDSFWPAGARASCPELSRTISAQEKRQAWDIACACALNLIE